MIAAASSRSSDYGSYCKTNYHPKLIGEITPNHLEDTDLFTDFIDIDII